MKTSMSKFFLLLGVLLIAAARPTSANLIVNGDFETGTLAGWTTAPAATEVTLASVPCLRPTILSVHSLVRMVPILLDQPNLCHYPGGFLPCELLLLARFTEFPHNGFRALFNGAAIYENSIRFLALFSRDSLSNLTAELTTLEFKAVTPFLGASIPGLCS